MRIPASLLAVVLIPVLACTSGSANPTAAPTSTADASVVFNADQMVGDWIDHENEVLTKFMDDRTYRFGQIAPASVFNEVVYEQGTWQLNEGVLSLVSSEAKSCDEGQRGHYRVAFEEPVLSLTMILDPCERKPVITVTLERAPELLR